MGLTCILVIPATVPTDVLNTLDHVLLLRTGEQGIRHPLHGNFLEFFFEKGKKT